MKLTPKQIPLVTAFLMSLTMACVMSFVMTVVNVGFSPRLLVAWPRSFIIGWSIAFPLALFLQFLSESSKLRPLYLKSLGRADGTYHIDYLPDSLKDIYLTVNGTDYELEDQTCMDFLPGFLLIHVEEYSYHKDTLNRMLDQNEYYFPFLVDYGSSYYALKSNIHGNDCGVYLISPCEPEPQLLFHSMGQLYQFGIICYEQNAFKIDEDGYLDVDFDLKFEIAQNICSDISYWSDE